VAALERVLAGHRKSGGMVVLATHLDIEMPDAATLDLVDFAPPHGDPETSHGDPETPNGAAEWERAR
jgi:heme exporter protein A